MTPDGEIHLWYAERVSAAGPLIEFLEPAERERAARFLSERHRDDFIFHHANLRRLLRQYTGAPVVLGVTPLGKPVICGGALHFNMSHSGPAGLYGFAGRELGVDIERLRPMPDAAQLAARFFTARERDAIGASEEAFFVCWTRKEAILKAHGDGLRRALNSIEVYPDPLPLRVGDFTLVPVPAIPGCVAAAAVAGGPAPVILRTLGGY